MKFKIYKTLCFSLCCMVILSCKHDFLQIVPEGEKVARTTEDYRLMLADPELAFYLYSGGWELPVIMGDEVAAEASYFRQASFPSQAAFRWEEHLYRTEDTDWTSRRWLNNLYQLNKVISEVQLSEGGTEEQKAQITAVAKANRAFIYFQLINYYGKPYLPSTASSDPGFPIILSADITVDKFKRNSVQEVYDFIIEELNGAIPDLALNPESGIQFNKAAAVALLGKVYLFKGNHADALQAFNLAFSHNAARTQPAQLYDYVKEFSDGGRFLPINYDGPNNSPGNNQYDFTESLVSKRFYNGPYNGNGPGNDPYVLDPKARELFEDSDLRLMFYAPEFPWSTPNPSGRLRKYGVKYTAFGIQFSELYLMRAEVKARLNDLSGAVADLETLREKRMPEADKAVPAVVASDRRALLSYIFDERTREFAMEGYRWFDMRRQSVDPLFTGERFSHTLYDFEAGTVEVFNLLPERLTLHLPINITNRNPDLIKIP